LFSEPAISGLRSASRAGVSVAAIAARLVSEVGFWVSDEIGSTAGGWVARAVFAAGTIAFPEVSGQAGCGTFRSTFGALKATVFSGEFISEVNVFLGSVFAVFGISEVCLVEVAGFSPELNAAVFPPECLPFCLVFWLDIIAFLAVFAAGTIPFSAILSGFVNV